MRCDASRAARDARLAEGSSFANRIDRLTRSLFPFASFASVPLLCSTLQSVLIQLRHTTIPSRLASRTATLSGSHLSARLFSPCHPSPVQPDHFHRLPVAMYYIICMCHGMSDDRKNHEHHKSGSQARPSPGLAGLKAINMLSSRE